MAKRPKGIAPTSPKNEPLLPDARIILSAELLLVPDALAAVPVAVVFDPLPELKVATKETYPGSVADTPDPLDPDAEADAISLTAIKQSQKSGLR